MGAALADPASTIASLLLYFGDACEILIERVFAEFGHVMRSAKA